jgi:hypothetical protein
VVTFETPFSLCVGEIFLEHCFILQCDLFESMGSFDEQSQEIFVRILMLRNVVFVRREKKFSSILPFSTTENFLS